MSKVLIIGAGGVGAVTAKKCAGLPEVFSDICVASRTLEKCERISRDIARPIATAQVDADNHDEVAALIDAFKADIVINTALPGQDLPIMEACVTAGAHYVDTSACEPDPSKYELHAYRWQWDFDERFKERGVVGLLSCGFDPGVVNVFCAYAQEKLFDEIHFVDIVDVNAGDHGKPFATNFDPFTNILEVTQQGMYYEDGRWVEFEPLTVSKTFELPEVGPRAAYLIYHEELETLSKFIPSIKRIRFWMGFSKQYLTHLRVLEDIGMTSLKPVDFDGAAVVPLKFLKKLLPDPASLASDYIGKTCIGCIIEGVKNGDTKRVFIYNVCDHQACYREVGSQAISYTTGVPAMIGAMLILKGVWRRPGVYCPEQLDPMPFMEELNRYGLPWHITEPPGISNE